MPEFAADGAAFVSLTLNVGDHYYNAYPDPKGRLPMVGRSAKLTHEQVRDVQECVRSYLDSLRHCACFDFRCLPQTWTKVPSTSILLPLYHHTIATQAHTVCIIATVLIRPWVTLPPPLQVLNNHKQILNSPQRYHIRRQIASFMVQQ